MQSCALQKLFSNQFFWQKSLEQTYIKNNRDKSIFSVNHLLTTKMNYQQKFDTQHSYKQEPLVESRTIYYNPSSPTSPYQGPKNVLYDSTPSMKFEKPRIPSLESYKLQDSYNNVYSPTYGTSQTTYQSPKLPNSDVKIPRESPHLLSLHNYENLKTNYTSQPTYHHNYSLPSHQPLRLTNHAFDEYIKTKRLTSLENQQRSPLSDFVPTSKNQENKQSKYYKSGKNNTALQYKINSHQISLFKTVGTKITISSKLYESKV